MEMYKVLVNTPEEAAEVIGILDYPPLPYEAESIAEYFENTKREQNELGFGNEDKVWVFSDGAEDCAYYTWSSELDVDNFYKCKEITLEELRNKNKE